jgi:hypothetical protein
LKFLSLWLPESWSGSNHSATLFGS